ncbi:MAG: PQQ-binding-like beta-propeller repeat protein [Luteitalea sp.]|nr:PQQ-binding-like beta-propeller repeat protein [Luteitalea sp.]
MGRGIRLETIQRYYSGVGRRPTTICCSAIALSVLSATIALAQQLGDLELRLFPTRAAWTLSLNAALTFPPGFADTRGYLPIDGARLAAYDLTGGALLWIVPAEARSEPVAGDGLVFLLEPSGLTARHDTDGSIAWQLPFLDDLAAPLVWDSGWLVAATASGRVLAFRATDGALIWRFEPGVPVHARPSFSGDRLYVPLEDSRLVALRVDNGIPIWERRLGGAPNEALVVGSRLYVGSNDNFFYCLRATTGEVDWRWRTGADVVGLPIVDDERVYFVSKDNVLRGLDRNNGAQRWKRALPLRPTRGLVRAGDALLVTGTAAKLFAFYLRDGAPAGEITGAGELAAAPHVTRVNGLPMVTLITLDIEKGAEVLAVTRSIEPAASPTAPLPNPIVPPKTMPPVTPTQDDTAGDPTSRANRPPGRDRVLGVTST